MKTKLITTASDPSHTGLAMLEKSLKKFGWGYDVILSDYVAFGTKMVNAYNYAKQTDCTHLFIVDAYDVAVLGTMEEAISNMPSGRQVWNAEKNAWPYEQWAMLYPEFDAPWKYLNGGCAFVEVDTFVKMFESHPIQHYDNDQVNLAKIYLTERRDWGMQLDYRCEVFQTMNSIEVSELVVEGGRLRNAVTGTLPVFFHGNGLHPMDSVYELI